MSQLDRLKANLPAGRPSGRPLTPPSRAEDVDHAGVVGDDRSGTELITQVLDEMDAEYVVEGDEISGIWENGLFLFGVLGDAAEPGGIFTVNGIWERGLPRDRLPAALAFANQWNAEHTWPKMFVRDDEGIVMLHGELAADLGRAPEFDQVDKLVNMAIVVALTAFDAAEAAFPEAELLS